jgi:hypothetical protein
LIDLIKTLGGWSLIGGQPKLDSQSLFNKISSFEKMNFKQFFEFFIYVNPKNQKTNILRVNCLSLLIFLCFDKWISFWTKFLKLQQPTWFYPKDIYTNTELINFYKEYATKFIETLNSRQKTQFNNAAEIDRMIKLEIDFANVKLNSLILSDVFLNIRSILKILLDQTEKRNQKYINTTVKELNINYTGVSKYFLNLISRR